MLVVDMSKKAFITGVTGQDGAYLAEFLLNKGYEVHGLKRRSSSFNTARIDHLYQDPHEKGVKFFLHHGDMTDSTSLTHIIQKVQPDEIYNLAAQSHVAVSFEEPEYTANSDALGSLTSSGSDSHSGAGKERPDFTRPRPPNFTAWCRKPRKRKPRLFIRAAPMVLPSFIPTGLP